MRHSCVLEGIYRYDAMYSFTIIGIDDNPHSVERNLSFVQEKLRSAAVFSGGKRHHELVKGFLPDSYSWIDITVPLERVFEEYEKSGREKIVVFASGDPLFFGFAATLRRRMPQAEIKVYPVFNSLQNLAHKLVMPYDDMTVVSLTGRPWHKFDQALIERRGKIGILTDKIHTPASIAAHAIEYGYTNYRMHIGECLGSEREQISTLTLKEAAAGTFALPNCLIMEMHPSDAGPEGDIKLPKRYFGIPHKEFALLDGREKMITKMPIRLLSLSMLDLHSRTALWDIGFCTGSVSIEAKMQFPHLLVDAFEIREQCAAIMDENCHKLGVPGINAHIGDFTAMDLPDMLQDGTVHLPDAVFIGGHGGKMARIMEMLSKMVPKGCIVVYNSVIECDTFAKAAQENGFSSPEKTEITVDNYNRITCCRCVRL